MNVLAYVHGYPPTHNAGAEHMMHAILRGLQERGMSVRVLCGPGKLGRFIGKYEGVDVRNGSMTDSELSHHFKWADVVLTHLDWTRRAIEKAAKWKRPLVHLVHNHNQLRYWQVNPVETALVVFNSLHLQKRENWRGKTMVLHPPVDPAKYIDNGQRSSRLRSGSIALLNLTEPKGVETFYAVAERLPHRHFLAVKGAYGSQVIRSLPNVEIVEHTADIVSVYRRCALVLMPSSYESWGRVAIEAACMGIPCIAHPTNGLRESMGSMAYFIDRDEHEKWAECIEWLLEDEQTYQNASDEGKARGSELDLLTDIQISQFASQLEDIAGVEVKPPALIDFYASTKVYFDHLAPVHAALDDNEKGALYVANHLVVYAHGQDIDALGVSKQPPASNRITVVASESDLEFVRSVRPRLAYMEHGAGQTYSRLHRSYANSPRRGVHVALATGPHVAALYAEAMPKTTIVEVGCPKLDRWLPTPPPPTDDRLCVVSFHYDAPGVAPEARTAFHWIKEALQSCKTILAMSGMDFAIHAHPRIQSEVFAFADAAGIETITSFNEVLKRASVFAVDNSSTYFEFAAVRGRVVSISPPFYRRDVEHGLRFWALADLGPEVTTNSGEALAKAIREAEKLSHAHVEEVRQRLAPVYGPLDGLASTRAVEVLRRANRPLEQTGHRKMKTPKLRWFRSHRSFVDRQRVVLVEVGEVVQPTGGNVSRNQRFAILDNRNSIPFLATSGHLFEACSPPTGYGAPVLPVPEKTHDPSPDVVSPVPLTPKKRPVTRRPKTTKGKGKGKGMRRKKTG